MLDKDKYKSCDYHCVIWYSSRRRIRLELKQSVKGNIHRMLDTFPPFEMSKHNKIFNSALSMRMVREQYSEVQKSHKDHKPTRE